FWSGDPVGRAIEIGNDKIVAAKILPGSYDYRDSLSPKQPRILEVVGVADNVAEGLIQQKPAPAIYLPLQQADYLRPPVQGITLLVRSRANADTLGILRREVAAMDIRVTLFDLRSMREQIDQFMAPLRIAAWTYALIGIFGLLLSTIGLAGMTAYMVAQRTRE